MGDENTILDEPSARHLLRRTGFGVTEKDLKRRALVGLTRGQAADLLLAFPPKYFKPRAREFYIAHNKWVKKMVRWKEPLQQKLVLFWHDHFATSFSVVDDIDQMGEQIKLLHLLCKGSLRDFVKAIGRNPAMMEMLDTARNRKAVPNENYARELMELFTLGVVDLGGNPNYTQDDIVQIARAFTGWDYDSDGVAFLRTSQHDYMAEFPERGPKVIFQNAHGFGPAGASLTADGEGAAEIDTVVDILFQHTDTAGKNTVARRTAHRLLEYFAYPGPDVAIVDAVVAASGFDVSFDVAALCRAIFVHDAFYETAAAAPFGPTTRKSVKWPIDYVVSTVRLLRMRLKGKDALVLGGSQQGMLDRLGNMGQTLMDPPDVFGWNWETDWLSSTALLARYNFARDIVAAREQSRFRPERFVSLTLTDPGEIVDAVARTLDVTHQLTGADRTVLIDYLTDGGLNPTIDLLDEGVRNTKLHGLFALVMQSPAYQVH
jgi:uncharacterized protein (DUF1800 family)